MVCGVTFIMFMAWRCGGVTTSQDGWDTERNKDGAYGRRAPSQFSGEGAWLAGRTALECCMATSIAAVAVRQLAKLPYEAGLALQLSLARKYKEEQLNEVRANLK